jgi:hypothetical protein
MNIKVQSFTYKTIVDMDTIIVETYGDGIYIRKDLYSIPAFTQDSAKTNVQFKSENFGSVNPTTGDLYELAVPPTKTEPTQQPTQDTPLPKQATSKKPVKYQPKSRVSKPKTTQGGEFVEKATKKEYKGKYIKDFKNRYFAGSSIEQNGVELEKVKSDNAYVNTLLAAGLALLFSALRGFFNKKVTKGDKQRGKTKRYFVQDKKNNKIVETDKDIFQQAQKELPNKRFVEMDWIIKGPAEDKVFNGYQYKGAESKNKEAILALESQMPGISTFITDYKLLVEDPIPVPKPLLTSETIVEKDQQTQLDNDRKANFDLRK